MLSARGRENNDMTMSGQVSERGTGGAVFAAVILVIGGAIWAVQGLAGIITGTSYNELVDHVITTDVSTWGWIHLIGGVIGMLAGLGIMSGAAWARALGITIAGISIVVNFAFIPFAPFWALTVILIDVWVIHSLWVHSRLDY